MEGVVEVLKAVSAADELGFRRIRPPVALHATLVKFRACIRQHTSAYVSIRQHTSSVEAVGHFVSHYRAYSPEVLLH